MAGISGSIGTIGSIEPRSWLFLVLSGLATGASWICYFKALGIGDVNKVVPVDKMSTVLAALIAIVLFFGETSNLAVKLVGTAVITLGTFLMIEKKQSAGPEQQQDRTARLRPRAAVFAALTSILAKVGIEGVESNPPRQSPAWYWLWHGRSWQPRENWIRSRTLTGANSHFSQHRASRPEHRGCSITTPSPQAVSVVVQIDKLSIVVSVLFARPAFNEKGLAAQRHRSRPHRHRALQRSQFGSRAASSRYILTRLGMPVLTVGCRALTVRDGKFGTTVQATKAGCALGFVQTGRPSRISIAAMGQRLAHRPQPMQRSASTANLLVCCMRGSPIA